MKRKSFLTANQFGAILKVAMSYSFIFLAVFLFASKPSGVLVANQTQEFFAPDSFSACISPSSYNNPFSPFHLPFGSVPTEKEQEVPDESDIEQDYHDDFSPMVLHYGLEDVFQTLVGGSYFHSSSAQIGNCASVPFFILYHSWKSFIS